MKEPGKNIVFIIDDDPSVRKALSFLLSSEGYEPLTFESAESFLSSKPDCACGCIVLDIRMKKMSGLELQDELEKRNIFLPVVFITGHGDIPTSVKVMKKGAFNFLTKPFDDKEFLSAVKEAINDSFSNFRANTEKTEVFEKMNNLTEREKEILKYVIAGYLNKQISAMLGIAEQTVKIHRGSIMKKLEVDSVADLVRKTELAGIIPEKR